MAGNSSAIIFNGIFFWREIEKQLIQEGAQRGGFLHNDVNWSVTKN